MELEHLQSLIPKELSLFVLSGASLQDPLARLSLFDLMWDSSSVKAFYPEALIEKKKIKVIDKLCLRWWITVG